jgi:hypothetical protein
MGADTGPHQWLPDPTIRATADSARLFPAGQLKSVTPTFRCHLTTIPTLI